MPEKRHYGYQLTSVIALIVSVIGAAVSFSKFLDWGAMRTVLGRFRDSEVESAMLMTFLFGVVVAVRLSLFRRDSSTEGKDAKTKQ